MDRYTGDGLLFGGMMRTSNKSIKKIRDAIANGRLSTKVVTMKAGARMDTMAAVHLGDSKLWWVIAAASGIGWCMQVPPGTRIVIPSNRSQLFKMF